MEKPNVIYIEELSEGDMEFKKKIISIIKKEFPLEVLEYRNSMKNNNFLNLFFTGYFLLFLQKTSPLNKI